MQMKSLLILLAMAVAACAAEITLDGKLDEAVWQKAEKHSGFVKAKMAGGSPDVKAQTEFSVLQEADAVYFGIKCHEPMMDKVIKKDKPASVWTDDGLEIFLAPSGMPLEFYQFRITVNQQVANLFYGEGGAIQPDPYSPDWQYKVHLDKDFWSCEVVFPLTAFYMTRQNLWRTEWLVNVCRTRIPERESTSWSPRMLKFIEPQLFRKMGSFPMRKEDDDVWVSDARAIVSGKRDNGALTGVLALTVNVPRRGVYTVNGKRMELKPGANKVSVPQEYAKSGRNSVPIVCKRVSDGKEFKRHYPVNATYEPLKIRLSLPEYRNNFYPGQDSSVIAGRIERIGGSKVTLTLSGDGLKTQTKVLDKSLDFSFDGKGFKEGATAELKAETQGITQIVKIRKLAPSKHKMSWISNGMLVIDGKPVMPRRVSAVYYHGGEAFKKKFDSDNLHITHGITSQAGWIEPFRLIKGIEQKEATRDVRPCDELFKKIDETIAKNKDRDFVSYEISDEPECRHVSPEYLGYIYRYLAEKDPYHVVHMCSRAASNYIDCADWFEPHPYINPVIFNGERKYGREINTIGSFLDEISLQNRSDKCVGLNATAFSYKYKSDASDYPNFREMICHIWAGMNHGAKTVKAYAYHDLGDRPSTYEGIRYLYGCMERLQDFILFAKRTFLVKTPDCEAMLYENGKDRMIVVVNMSTRKINASLPDVKGTFFEFRGPRTFSKFDFELEPQEVIVATSRKMDEGLKPRAEVAAEIDKLEEARKNRGNILFNRHNEIEVTASRPTGSCYKMFDGVTDVYAFQDVRGKNKFFEMAFPKFVPKFKTIRVYGDNIQGMTVKIRKRGDWITLKPDKIEEGEYMQTLSFNEELSTVKMRLEFPKDKLELYEIELLK
ncbi:MAG: hypothetical protein IKS20_07420 [Victivallales bacterium]|nr:hypothetical protein [Victivallales bacterium]